MLVVEVKPLGYNIPKGFKKRIYYIIRLLIRWKISMYDNWGLIMAIHITELNIETYRGIKSLKLNNLAPINIITGDNNCGKTSVLEVLRSIENPSDFRLWRTLIRRNSNDIRDGISYFEGFAICLTLIR